MKIGISLEVTKQLRNTWHSAINHEWYEFLKGHTIYPLVCYGSYDVREYDLIILCGGNDMAGMPTWRDNNSPDRDSFEQLLLSDAIENKVPVVGICRGFHFMNKTLGGTLRYLDEPYDNVPVILGELTVQCHHTIAVDKLAPGFESLLQDCRNVIELASDTSRKLLGVGWHPERMINFHTRDIVLSIIEKMYVNNRT